MPLSWLQGRSVKDSTLRRAQRRSFTPASFLEEDTVDFPDELDTSFFARVRGRSGMVLAQRQSRTLLLAGLCVGREQHCFLPGLLSQMGCWLLLMGLLSLCPGRSPS